MAWRSGFVLRSLTTDSPPVAGAWQEGTVVVGANGTVSICTVTGSPGTWVSASGGPGASDLADLGDVDLTGLADTDLLTWDSGAGKWIPLARSTFALAAAGVTNGDSHDHAGGDGGTIAYTSLSGTPNPAPILLASISDKAEASSYFTGTHTTAQLGSDGKDFSFPLPFTMLENHFGAGHWKITVYFQAKNQVAGDNYSLSFHDYSNGATIGSDYSTTSTLTSIKLFTATWLDSSANWPAANIIASVAPYSTSGGAGHVFYFYGGAVYAEYDP